ncbi:hypothetical protein HRbin18_01918 [bacterium HR18]|nr:hypothetical protein HRbin18_01918 [bacterium HR18]
MSRVDLMLETVTPLFLAGADQGKPELRAASMRGALRFWLRALLGGCLGDRDLSNLRQRENAVFGSTDQGASSVVIRLWDRDTKHIHPNLVEGVSYLFFAAKKRKAIEGHFRLTLSTRPGVQADVAKKAFEQAYAALWLLTHLGGLGLRSRRGAGSLQVVGQVQGDVPSDLPELPMRAKTPAELQSELAIGLQQLRKWIGSSANVASPSAFDVLHPNTCDIWVVDQTFISWNAALDRLGQAMQSFRNRRQPDYQNVKNVVGGSTRRLPTVERAAFGLPIVFYYRSLGGRWGTLEGETHDRRASPLFIRVVRLADKKYTVVMTLFKAELLESGEKLALKHGKSILPTTSVPGLNLIGDCLNSLGIGLLEVKNW